jgi:hypothetical protein
MKFCPDGLGDTRQNVKTNYMLPPPAAASRATHPTVVAKKQSLQLSQHQRPRNHVVKRLFSLRETRHDITNHQRERRNDLAEKSS